jgi:hypothetical protein
VEAGNQRPVAERSQVAQRSMEARKQCAYNQTRGRFLGMDLDAGDFSVASLGDRMPALTPKSGGGLWIVPFRGISPASVRTPLDLVYLDRNCEVIDVVESFPLYRSSQSTEPAASVLALPSRTIDSTQTRTGDRLVLCAPEEMQWRLKEFPSPRPAACPTESTAPRKQERIPGSILSPVQRENHPIPKPPAEALPRPRPSNKYALIQPEIKPPKPAKSWLERWLNPDPPDLRKTPREPLPGLAAYFFTGGAPEEHRIRNISSSGLYVVTEERWYLGTVVRMTLTDSAKPIVERSITVHASSVRWGNDGVGLHFVLKNEKDKRRGQTPLGNAVNGKQLDGFLHLMRSGAN